MMRRLAVAITLALQLRNAHGTSLVAARVEDGYLLGTNGVAAGSRSPRQMCKIIRVGSILVIRQANGMAISLQGREIVNMNAELESDLQTFRGSAGELPEFIYQSTVRSLYHRARVAPNERRGVALGQRFLILVGDPEQPRFFVMDVTPKAWGDSHPAHTMIESVLNVGDVRDYTAIDPNRELFFGMETQEAKQRMEVILQEHARIGNGRTPPDHSYDQPWTIVEIHNSGTLQWQSEPGPCSAITQ